MMKFLKNAESLATVYIYEQFYKSKKINIEKQIYKLYL